MDMRLSLISQSGSEPVDLSQVKAEARIDSSDEDNYLTRLIVTARAQIEAETGRALRRQTWEAVFRCFPSDGSPIILPKPPLISVDFIKYVDENGDLQTLAISKYQVSAPSGMYAHCGRIAEAYDQSWPVVRDQMDAVTIRFTCGYDNDASPTEAPPEAERAVTDLAVHWWANRAPVMAPSGSGPMPFGLDAVIFPLKVWRV